MLLDFNNERPLPFSPVHLKRIMDAGKDVLIGGGIEMDIDNRAYDLGNVTDIVHENSFADNSY